MPRQHEMPPTGRPVLGWRRVHMAAFRNEIRDGSHGISPQSNANASKLFKVYKTTIPRQEDAFAPAHTVRFMHLFP
jgi:hypothetical protein